MGWFRSKPQPTVIIELGNPSDHDEIVAALRKAIRTPGSDVRGALSTEPVWTCGQLGIA